MARVSDPDERLAHLDRVAGALGDVEADSDKKHGRETRIRDSDKRLGWHLDHVAGALGDVEADSDKRLTRIRDSDE